MNWQNLKHLNKTLDRILLWISVVVVLSYPIEWFIRYMRAR
jgi:hypothetical protein